MYMGTFPSSISSSRRCSPVFLRRSSCYRSTSSTPWAEKIWKPERVYFRLVHVLLEISPLPGQRAERIIVEGTSFCLLVKSTFACASLPPEE
jgi:hypothetical protein